MKKILFTILISSVASGLALAEAVKKPECPMMTKGKKCAVCPEKMKGVETVSRNTADGVEITMTAKDKETVAKVQELALVHYNNGNTMDENCPGRVEGARINITNTETGAKAEITGTTPEMIRKIQEASRKEHQLSGPVSKIKKGSKKGTEKMDLTEKK
jgi:hypothetical protein